MANSIKPIHFMLRMLKHDIPPFIHGILVDHIDKVDMRG